MAGNVNFRVQIGLLFGGIVNSVYRDTWRVRIGDLNKANDHPNSLITQSNVERPACLE